MDRHSRELIGYGVAVVAVALALVIKILFSGLGADHPFVLLPAAVIVSAWYGGPGPRLLAQGMASIGAGSSVPPPPGCGVPGSALIARVSTPAQPSPIIELTYLSGTTTTTPAT